MYSDSKKLNLKNQAPQDSNLNDTRESKFGNSKGKKNRLLKYV